MSTEIQLSWSALDTLIPLCLELKERLGNKENIDFQDVASKVGSAFGIEDVDEFIKEKVRQGLERGFGTVLDGEDSKKLSALFAGLCKPVMTFVFRYVKGEANASQLLRSLEDLYARNAADMQHVLEQELGISGEAAELLAGKIVRCLVSVHCFAGAYKIYQRAAQDAELARQHRLEIERLSAEAISRLKAERQELESRLDEFLLSRLDPFDAATMAMDQAIVDDDDDGFVSANAELWELFGRKAQYRSAAEFDGLMSSDEAFKL